MLAVTCRWTTPTTAILLGGMVIWGLEPGPLVFVDHPDFTWGLIASLYVANIFALLINVAFIPAFIWVLKMPFTILAPIIFVLCVIGGYVPTMDMHDVWLMLIFGVVAPESANNAASTGAMLPMLTLGIPGSPTTAILLGGMVIWGLEPGPLVFTDHPDFVWGFIASLYVANLFSLLINVAFIPAFIWVLKMPFTILAPIIFVLCIVGGFVPTLDMHDVWLMLIFGVVGYLMRKLDYPMAPAVLAIVLGPLAEPALRQSLLISGGSFSIFFTRPYAGVITMIAIGLFVLPLIKIALEKRRPSAEA